jgi:hypothetical protein
MLKLEYIFFSFILHVLQDGRIDYNEFVAMMQKGDNLLGRKGQSTDFGLGEALKLR